MTQPTGPFVVVHPEGDFKRLSVLDVQQLAYGFRNSLILATKKLFEEPDEANHFASHLAELNYITPAQVAFV